MGNDSQSKWYKSFPALSCLISKKEYSLLKHLNFILILALFVNCRTGSLVDLSNDDVFSREKIIEVMHKVNDYRHSHPWTEEDDFNWIRGTYYTGVTAFALATGEEKPLMQAIKWGEEHSWKLPPLPDPDSWASGANILTCGQTWLQCYFLKKDPAMYRETEKTVNSAHPKTFTGSRVWYTEAGRRYVDALYVAPPTLAMLGKATGEEKYYTALNEMFWDVYTHLFDKDAGLFYRDDRFIIGYQGKVSERDRLTEGDHRKRHRTWVYQTSQNGKKVLWSRGNGWAHAGIARILQYLPASDIHYNRFIKLFKTMSEQLKKRQGNDGLWRVNLDDAKEYPNPETSGSGFFCYGLAWGLNNSILEKDEYLPVVRKAWRGLYSAIDGEGKVCWGQPVAGGPYEVRKENSHEYVSGQFLLAGSEVFKLFDDK